MANKIIFGADLIDVLENKYNMNKLGEVPTKYKNGVTTIDFIYGKEKNIDNLKYDKPYIEFSIDDETDGFISGTMYLNGGVEGIQFDSWDDLKYFVKNAKQTESKKSVRKNLKESLNSDIKLMVNRIVDDLISEYSSKEWNSLSAMEKWDIITRKYYSFGGKTKYVSEVRDLVVENMNHPFNVVFESNKSAKKSLKEFVDGYIATDEDCNMSGKCWVLGGSYNFIMDFLQEWGIAPEDVKVKNGMTTLFNADGNPFGYVYQDDEVDIFVADKTTNWTWKNHNPSTKRVKVTALDEIF